MFIRRKKYVDFAVEGFDLYLDYLDGYVTEEEFDEWIKEYEM